MKKLIFMLYLVSFTSASLYNQEKAETFRIKGTVIDAAKNRVAGASISIDGIPSGVTTDTKGKYSVTVTGESHTIRAASSSGISAGEAIGNRKKINIILPEDIMTGDQSVGDKEGEYAIRQGKSMKRAASREEARQRRMASYNTIYDMIRGEVPGVQVMGESITIEGISSLHMSSEPLFVVNGVPVNSIDFISPSMVRSIEVLKGSATSFYGLRGVNGVIVITLHDAVE